MDGKDIRRPKNIFATKRDQKDQEEEKRQREEEKKKEKKERKEEEKRRKQEEQDIRKLEQEQATVFRSRGKVLRSPPPINPNLPSGSGLRNPEDSSFEAKELFDEACGIREKEEDLENDPQIKQEGEEEFEHIEEIPGQIISPEREVSYAQALLLWQPIQNVLEETTEVPRITNPVLNIEIDNREQNSQRMNRNALVDPQI